MDNFQHLSVRNRRGDHWSPSGTMLVSTLVSYEFVPHPVRAVNNRPYNDNCTPVERPGCFSACFPFLWLKPCPSFGRVLIMNIFCNVFQFAIQCSAKLVKSLCFHILICLESADRLAVNSALLSQLIGWHILFFHCLPKPVKSNHHAAPPSWHRLLWGL